jgi:hypothetical protein
MTIDLDTTVLAKALAYAIAFIDGLPQDQREEQEDDRSDMVHVLSLMIPCDVERERLAVEAERTVGRLPDLTDWKLRE